MKNESVIGEKPCLVKTQQGFSLLYKNRYLYSKYQPKTAIIKYIEGLKILPNTLILCYAPALGYGLKELLQKLPEDCSIVTIDFDENLFSLFKDENKELLTAEKKITPILLKKAVEIVQIIQKGDILQRPESFKRALVIKMSAATAFNEDEYKAVTEYTDDYIKSNWKNVITLTRMGRLFALDILKNLKKLYKDGKFHCLNRSSINKPILVIGAGSSTDELLSFLPEYRDNFFIICVDAALPSLLENGIKADAVVAVECQLAIEKAYIGAINSGIHIIADLTSRPKVTRLCGGNLSFFLSDYCSMPFMTKLKESVEKEGIPVFPALGSVGLYAVEIALYLRKAGSPVFICGLDFSFKPGQTHCKAAPAHTASILKGNRLSPLGSPAAAYKFSAHKIIGKNEDTLYTDAALSGYGSLYVERYKDAKAIFDCAKTGMKGPFPQISYPDMMELAKQFSRTSDNSIDFSTESTSRAEISYITEQRVKLNHLKDLLTGKEKEASENELESIIKECSYLYAHFPDARSGSIRNQDFLNRIRAETEIFLKALGK